MYVVVTYYAHGASYSCEEMADIYLYAEKWKAEEHVAGLEKDNLGFSRWEIIEKDVY